MRAVPSRCARRGNNLAGGRPLRTVMIGAVSRRRREGLCHMETRGENDQGAIGYGAAQKGRGGSLRPRSGGAFSFHFQESKCEPWEAAVVLPCVHLCGGT